MLGFFFAAGIDQHCWFNVSLCPQWKLVILFGLSALLYSGPIFFGFSGHHSWAQQAHGLHDLQDCRHTTCHGGLRQDDVWNVQTPWNCHPRSSPSEFAKPFDYAYAMTVWLKRAYCRKLQRIFHIVFVLMVIFEYVSEISRPSLIPRIFSFHSSWPHIGTCVFPSGGIAKDQSLGLRPCFMTQWPLQKLRFRTGSCWSGSWREVFITTCNDLLNGQDTAKVLKYRTVRHDKKRRMMHIC